MAEVIIPDIMLALKAVSHSNSDNLHIRYDKEAEIMWSKVVGKTYATILIIN